MSENTAQTLQPPEWPRPRGYSNGIVASGRQIFVAGQIGWDAQGRFASNRLADQVGQALANICAVLAQAGAGPEHVVRLTWYLTSREEYHAEIADIGAAYRAVMGKHYPAMSVVQVVALMEAEAKVEIEATAVIPGGRRRASRRHGGASGRSVAADVAASAAPQYTSGTSISAGTACLE